MLLAVEAVSISLLTTDVKFRKLVGVSREMIEKARKSLNILVKRSNIMWYILLSKEEAAKKLAESILIAKSVRLQTEYMDTRKTRVTLHGVAMDISKDHLVAFSPNTSPSGMSFLL